MGISAVQYKLMPESLDIDLSKLKEEAKSKIEQMGGVYSDSEERPIAFGLKALIISLAYPEEKEIDELGNALGELAGVSSAEMIDYRRAVG
jgi:elongation factor 1-beta